MDVSKWIGRLLYQIKYLVHFCRYEENNKRHRCDGGRRGGEYKDDPEFLALVHKTGGGGWYGARTKGDATIFSQKNACSIMSIISYNFCVANLNRDLNSHCRRKITCIYHNYFCYNFYFYFKCTNMNTCT